MKSLLFSTLILVPALSWAGVLLPPSKRRDNLTYRVTNVATKWGDNNISTGTTAVAMYDLAGEYDHYEVVGREAFEKNFKAFGPNMTNAQRREFLNQLKFKDDETEISERAVGDVARAVADGNAYDLNDRETIEGLKRDIWAMARALGKNVTIISAETKVKEDDGDIRKIWSFVLTAPSETRVVTIFVIEGRM